MGHPRFIFSTTWGPGFLPVEAGDFPPDLSQAPTVVRWRLLSANNRQLGRSAAVFDDVAAARAAALALQDSLGAVDQVVTRLATPPRWVWSLVRAGTVVAVSGRSYETERAVVRTLSLFLSSAAAAPVAVVNRLPRPRRTSHPSLRAFDGAAVS